MSRLHHTLVLVLLTATLAACGQPGGPSTTSLQSQAVVCQVWNAGTAYVQGDTVTYQGASYRANWWTQGDTPSTHSGATGSGQPWTATASCGSTPTPTPTPNPTPTPPPAGGLVFGPYKDVTINMDWNTNVMSTLVTGTRQPVLNVLPAKVGTVTWSFATGECGSETWGGVQGQALANANVPAFVNAGRGYILSTGGAAGSFTCGSDAGFTSFIQRYSSAQLRGVDFDIEGGQSQATINNLVQRVKAAQGKFPALRFSFTLATLGGNAAQSLGTVGVTTMQAIQANGLQGAIINLMVMDYGSANAGNCTLNASGRCDMGQSAIQAARRLHDTYGVPYNRIELTPMIGGNDTQDETFSLSDVTTLAQFVRQNGLAGVHFWSLDRDVDCAPGYASPTCNSYGQAGTWGFSNRFATDLGL